MGSGNRTHHTSPRFTVSPPWHGPLFPRGQTCGRLRRLRGRAGIPPRRCAPGLETPRASRKRATTSWITRLRGTCHRRRIFRIASAWSAGSVIVNLFRLLSKESMISDGTPRMTDPAPDVTVGARLTHRHGPAPRRLPAAAGMLPQRHPHPRRTQARPLCRSRPAMSSASSSLRRLMAGGTRSSTPRWLSPPPSSSPCYVSSSPTCARHERRPLRFYLAMTAPHASPPTPWWTSHNSETAFQLYADDRAAPHHRQPPPSLHRGRRGRGCLLRAQWPPRRGAGLGGRGAAPARGCGGADSHAGPDYLHPHAPRPAGRVAAGPSRLSSRGSPSWPISKTSPPAPARGGAAASTPPSSPTGCRGAGQWSPPPRSHSTRTAPAHNDSGGAAQGELGRRPDAPCGGACAHSSWWRCSSWPMR